MKNSSGEAEGWFWGEGSGGQVQGPVVQGSGAPAQNESPRRESLLTWHAPRSYWTVFLL